MFGLVGPDGAGKTTTIRILCGLIHADGGSFDVLGKDGITGMQGIRKEIGYLSQRFSLYGDLSVDENIEFFADINNITGYKERRNELLEFTRLMPFRDRLAEKLSGGMKQKLALTCSLIHRPKLLFLDEPTTGVDPVSRRDFWKILSGLLRQQITIVMTTPYLDEAERCARVAMMHNGEIIALDTPQNIKEQMNLEVAEVVCSPARKAYELIKNTEGFEAQLFGDRINVVLKSFEKGVETLNGILLPEGVNISRIRQVTPSLENVFIHKILSSY